MLRLGHVEEKRLFLVKVAITQECVMSSFMLNILINGSVREVNVRVFRRGVGLLYILIRSGSCHSCS